MGLLAVAQAQTNARVINSRTDNLVKTYGFDSPIAQDAMTNIIDAVPAENIKFVNGVPHIIKPAKLSKAGVDLKPLKKDVKTVKQVREEKSDSYETYLFEQEFTNNVPIDIDTFIIKKEKFESQRSKIKQISEDPNSIEDGDIIIKTLKSPINTYDELFDISEQIEEYEAVK